MMEDGQELRWYFSVLRRRWWLILVCTLRGGICVRRELLDAAGVQRDGHAAGRQSPNWQCQ